MRRTLILFLILMLLSGCLACQQRRVDAETPTPAAPGQPHRNEEANMVFQPVVAGAFYTDNPNQLATMVNGFIAEADVPADLGDVFGIVAPHAGYVYSGPVAGHSFRAVQGKKYDVVVVMGLSHRVPVDVCVLDYDAYRTPLGDIKIDRESSRKLIAASPLITDDDAMFRMEHSLEVELPFVQLALPHTPIVMIGIGTVRQKHLQELARALDETFAGKKALFVASTDMSHFRSYDSARKIDRDTLTYLERGDIDGLLATPDCRERLCGLGPVVALYELFKRRGGSQFKVLTYQNSGDTAGDKSRVVGYGSIVLLGGNAGEKTAEAQPAKDKDDPFTDAEKQQMLSMARETVMTFVRTGKKPDFTIDNPKLKEPGAAFVTLHKKSDHQLRGCIGQIVATMPLWECIREMAVAAASQDPRFTPVKEKELDNLHIEISVLTKPVKIKNVEEIVVGKHGLIMSRGWQRGLLLPQVPTEWGWDRDKFLDQTCLKAGMGPGCWRDDDVVIETFTAVVFAE